MPLTPQNLRSTWSTWQKSWSSMWSQAEWCWVTKDVEFCLWQNGPKNEMCFQFEGRFNLRRDCCPKRRCVKSFRSFFWRFGVIARVIPTTIQAVAFLIAQSFSSLTIFLKKDTLFVVKSLHYETAKSYDHSSENLCRNLLGFFCCQPAESQVAFGPGRFCR